MPQTIAWVRHHWTHRRTGGGGGSGGGSCTTLEETCGRQNTPTVNPAPSDPGSGCSSGGGGCSGGGGTGGACQRNFGRGYSRTVIVVAATGYTGRHTIHPNAVVPQGRNRHRRL